MATIWPTAIFSRIGPAGGTRRLVRAAFVACALLASASGAAQAFSQITREDGSIVGPGDIISEPLPPLDPDRSGNAPEWGLGLSAPAERPAEERAAQDPAGAEPLAVHYDDEGLPDTVRDLRQRLIDIARTGEIEALRPYLETGSNPTALAVTPMEGDPIEFLKAASGDDDGVEILAILLDVLRAGHVRLEEGTDAEIYVWPYFTQVPLDELTRPQLVELFQIVTAGDYREMLDLGAYYFYRVGISPEGRLEFFLAGD